MRGSFLTAATLLMLSVGSGSAQVPSEGARNPEELRRLLTKWTNAMIQRDAAILDSLLADEFVFVSPRGRRIPKASYVANRDTGGVFGAQSFAFDEVAVRFVGPVAASITRYSGTSRSREPYTGLTYEIEGDYTRTDIWIWSDGRWRALSTQLTPIGYPGARAASTASALRGTTGDRPQLTDSPMFPGAEVAVLYGMPYTGGYTVRLTRPDGHVERAHRHDSDEHVTVTSGILHVGVGDSLDRRGTRTYRSGDYVVIPAGTPHYSWTEGAVRLDVYWNGAAAPTYADAPRKR